jgi:hypothetical protein
MNIQTVAENLKNTIAGKEKYLAEMDNINMMAIPSGEAMAHRATYDFLQINIDELKRILEDVEQCRSDWTEYLNPVTGEK